MKILLITLEYPPIIGGVSTYLRELYNTDQHEIRIYSPANIRMSYWWCWPHWFPLYVALRKIVAEYKPDQIHISHVLPMGHIARWLGVPYVILFHGTDLLTAHAQPRKWSVVEKIVAGAHQLVVNSAATGELFERLLPRAKKPHIIPPGVKPAVVTDEGIIERHNLSGRRYVLFLARLVERKGLRVAIDALLRLRQHNVPITLVVAGEGPERAIAEKMVAEHGLEHDVVFVGKVTEAEKNSLYAHAHVFWFPAQPVRNEWEGFGISSLEAQQAGCPVIVSALGGLPETVVHGESGYAVLPTAGAFAEQTEIILADASLWQMLRVGARANAARHAWSLSVERFWNSVI